MANLIPPPFPTHPLNRPMSKRNSPCTNYPKPSDDWRLNDTKPCDYCKEPMIPAPTTKKHLWKKKKYCSSYCSASARSPYASKVLGPLLLALGLLLTAPGASRASVSDLGGGSPGGYSVWHVDHWDWMGVHADPPSSVPEPSNPGVLLAVAGAALLARRARKP